MRVHRKLFAFWKNNFRPITDASSPSPSPSPSPLASPLTSPALLPHATGLSRDGDQPETSQRLVDRAVASKPAATCGSGDFHRPSTLGELTRRKARRLAVHAKLVPGIRVYEATDQSRQQQPADKPKESVCPAGLLGRLWVAGRHARGPSLPSLPGIAGLKQPTSPRRKTPTSPAVPGRRDRSNEQTSWPEVARQQPDDGTLSLRAADSALRLELGSRKRAAVSALETAETMTRRRLRFFIHPDTPNVPPDLIRATGTVYSSRSRDTSEASCCQGESNCRGREPDYTRLFHDDLDSSSGSSLNSWMNPFGAEATSARSRASAATADGPGNNEEGGLSSGSRCARDEAMFAVRTAILATGIECGESLRPSRSMPVPVPVPLVQIGPRRGSVDSQLGRAVQQRRESTARSVGESLKRRRVRHSPPQSVQRVLLGRFGPTPVSARQTNPRPDEPTSTPDEVADREDGQSRLLAALVALPVWPDQSDVALRLAHLAPAVQVSALVTTVASATAMLEASVAEAP
ncbi:unnamed protein product, partial [Protopolystoma xenopodis]